MPPHQQACLGTRLLNRVERIGNALPDPMTLFLVGSLLVLVLSQIADWRGWSIDKQVAIQVDGQWQVQTVTVRAVGLLTRDGFYWTIRHLVSNLTGFAPLGVVLVGMLGIGVAEKTGEAYEKPA